MDEPENTILFRYISK